MPMDNPSSDETQTARSETAEATGSYSPNVVVGIGASAGGLEAVCELLRHVPDDTGLTFVYISHLDPTRDSALSEILGKVTRMTVTEVRHGDTIEPNHVFIIPPGSDLIITNDRLLLTSRESGRDPHMPTDKFLCSLAEERQSRSIAVILSGTGSDGMLGVKAVKAAGGITFAQDETADQSGMPRAAISSGFVDAVLSPQKIAEELVRIVRHPYLHPTAMTTQREPLDDNDAFTAILQLLSRVSTVDFTHYKRPTLTRRIERRMVLIRIDTYAEYLECLRQQPQELQALYEEVLIQVTGFFRDPEVFEALKNAVFPVITAERSSSAEIRIWVAGCATGEEVYSIAISLLEYLHDTGCSFPVKIFGTDISTRAIEFARSGVYAENIATEVSEQRLLRFFTKTDSGFQINKTVREVCVFARHDVTKDPPFSSLDLVTCRNLLIYLDSILQNRVLPVFHYALKPAGFLILGVSETIGAFAQQFETVEQKTRLYRSKPVSGRQMFDFARRDHAVTTGVAAESVQKSGPTTQTIQREADRIVLDRYAPAGVVIDSDLRVVQYRGQTGKYLQPPPGPPTNELVQMVREGLLSPLTECIEQAKQQGRLSWVEGVRVRTNGDRTTVTLEVLPFSIPPSGERFFVLLFDPTDSDAVVRTRQEVPEKLVDDPQQELLRLTQELTNTQNYLRSIIEDKEATNEELRAANEEVVSSNEELQSTNEEMETAKEELQATNEELTTVNEELANRISVANRLSDDLTNLIDGIDIPTVIVTHDLKIRRFSPSARQVLNLTPTDIGRPISDFKLKIDVPDLEPIILEVLDSLVAKEREVVDLKGRYHRMSIRPYKTNDNRIDGVVVTLTDINELKEKERALTIARDYRTDIIETLHQPLLVLNSNLHVRTTNTSFCQTFGMAREQTEGRLIFTLDDGKWDIPALRSMLEELLTVRSVVQNYAIEHVFPGIGHRVMLLNGRRVHRTSQDCRESILLAFEDITDRRQTESALDASQRHVQSIVETAADGIVTFDRSGIIRSFNPAAEGIFDRLSDDVLGRHLSMLMSPSDSDEIGDLWASGVLDFRVAKEVTGHRKGGATFPMQLSLTTFHDGGEQIFNAILRDVSVLRAAEERALQAERLAAIGEAMTGLAHESRNAIQRSQSCIEMLQSRVGKNKEAGDLLASLQSAQNELQRLYEEVREYAAPVAKRMQPADIRVVLEETWNDTVAVNQQREAHLTIADTSSDMTCSINANSMRQVFRNLFENSFAACSDPVEVAVSFTDTQLDDRPALQISLSDNGPGMTADVKQHLFEPFYTTSIKGTGLGLAIVQRIIEAHRGRVGTGSRSGSGAEIVVVLPRNQTS